MREITQFEQYTLEIWRRPRQRHMHLTVRPNGHVRVTCNRRVARRAVFEFVGQVRDFIDKRLSEHMQLEEKFPPKSFVSGDTFLYLGAHRPLQVIWRWDAKIEVRFDDNEFEMKAPLTSRPAERQEALFRFFRRQGQILFRERLHHWSEQMQLFPRRLSVRGQWTRWGSCSARGEISLNWKLMCAPLEVIDYVIIHELAHLRHLNHSRQFWELVTLHSPQRDNHRRWLKEHQEEIRLFTTPLAVRNFGGSSESYFARQPSPNAVGGP